MRWIFALVVVVGTASADDIKGDKKLAERYFHAGEKAYQAQRFAAAADDFEHAFQALPDPRIAFSAAQAYRRLFQQDRNVDYAARAVELYKLYLANVHSGGRVADAADGRSEMEQALEKMIKAGAKVSPQLAAEHTQLGISPELGDAGHGGMNEIEETGAHVQPKITVMLDGNPVQPYVPNNVVPGDHKVHIEAPGYIAVDRIDNVVQGTSNMLEVVLAPKPAHVAITAEDGAQISVDGRPATASLEIPAGKHLLTIVRRGREPFARELVLANGQQLNVDAPLAPTWRRKAVTPLVVVGGTAAIVAIGAGIWARHEDANAKSDSDAIHNQGNQAPSVLADYRSSLDDRGTLRSVAWWSGIGAVAVGAAAAALWYFDEPSPDLSRVTPLVGPGTAGAAIAGHF